ncbi:MAG: hypothetical protein ACT4NV_07375 [Rhodoferax sp.]
MSALVQRLTVSYKDFIAEAQTGDILLMHGRRMSSKLIELLQDSLWSHATMIVRGKDIGVQISGDPLLIWESNVKTRIEDVILKKPKKNGPMLVRLEDRIRANFKEGINSMFAVRHLHVERTQAMFDGLSKAIDEVHSKPFPDVISEFWNAFEGRILNQACGNGSFFCSQLLAYSLKKMGLLSAHHPDNAFIPLDFSEAMDVSMRQRAWLAPEMQLDTQTIITALSKTKQLKFGPPITQENLDRELRKEIAMVREALMKAHPQLMAAKAGKPVSKKQPRKSHPAPTEM